MKEILETIKRKVKAGKIISIFKAEAKIFEGSFKNNKAHGKGLSFKGDGNTVEIEWKNGVISTKH